MIAKQIANLIPDIVAARESSPTDRWALVILEEKIQCIPIENIGSQGYPLMPITMHHVDKGLSGREWDRIINRIATYQETHPDFYAEPTETTMIASGKTESTSTANKDETKPQKNEDLNETKTTTDPE